jgi:hypothetical protein
LESGARTNFVWSQRKNAGELGRRQELRVANPCDDQTNIGGTMAATSWAVMQAKLKLMLEPSVSSASGGAGIFPAWKGGAGMNTTEISEEAKQALADGAQRKARDRLFRDGCNTYVAMRRRVLALAAERNLPPVDYAKLMHKHIMDRSIHEFCSKHNVSLDWLMEGDLKGLQRMKQWADEKNRGMTVQEHRSEIIRLLLALPPETQKLASDRFESWEVTPMRKAKRLHRRSP